MLFAGAGSVIGTIIAFIFTAGFIFLLFRPYKEHGSIKINMNRIVNQNNIM